MIWNKTNVSYFEQKGKKNEACLFWTISINFAKGDKYWLLTIWIMETLKISNQVSAFYTALVNLYSAHHFCYDKTPLY